MGTEQRKHPATTTGKRHICPPSSPYSSTGWRQLCHYSAKTVWMYLSNVLKGVFLNDLWLLCSSGPLRRKCECMMEMIHSMFGIGKANIETIQRNSDVKNVASFVKWFFFNRYIKWTEQTFPQGGKESNLNTLLEQAVTRFTDVEKYHNDPRYVELWIKFVCVTFPFLLL